MPNQPLTEAEGDAALARLPEIEGVCWGITNLGGGWTVTRTTIDRFHASTADEAVTLALSEHRATGLAVEQVSAMDLGAGDAIWDEESFVPLGRVVVRDADVLVWLTDEEDDEPHDAFMRGTKRLRLSEHRASQEAPKVEPGGVCSAHGNYVGTTCPTCYRDSVRF